MVNSIKSIVALILIFTSGVSHAQDMMVLTSGDVRNVKVMEVTSNFIRYRVTDSLDSSFYRISTDSVYSIKYKNGSKDFFNKGGTYHGINKNEMEEPNLASNFEMKQRGVADAKEYYHGSGGCVTGTVLGTLCGDIVGGLFVAGACAATPPAENKLGCPDRSLMKNKSYANAYRTEAYKIKKKKTWTAFGVTAGIYIAVIGAIFYGMLQLGL